MSQTTSAPPRPNAPSLSGPPDQEGGGIAVQGGAAILAPIQSFPNGVPANAMVLIPLGPNGAPVEKEIVDGPVKITMEQVWKLLGFNGPAVQVQDEQGRPIAIGLEDLLSGLEKHWVDSQDDLDRGRIYSQELMKYQRHEKAEAVLAKIVARGGDGQDWLALGVAQLAQDKHDKAEGTLKGAQNLMKDNPYPSLHLAKLFKGKKDIKAEREAVERAIQIQPGNVDAWAYLFNYVKEADGEEKALAQIEELANAPVNAKTAAPYVALQGFYAGDEATRDKAITILQGRAVGGSTTVNWTSSFRTPAATLAQQALEMAPQLAQAIGSTSRLTGLRDSLAGSAPSPVVAPHVMVPA